MRGGRHFPGGSVTLEPASASASPLTASADGLLALLEEGVQVAHGARGRRGAVAEAHQGHEAWVGGRTIAVDALEQLGFQELWVSMMCPNWNSTLSASMISSISRPSCMKKEPIALATSAISAMIVRKTFSTPSTTARMPR